MVSIVAARLTMTCRMRGSRERAYASTSRSSAILSGLGRLSTGSIAGYSARASCSASGLPAPLPPCAIARAAFDAYSNCGKTISSE
jgi:hypothetical protein